MEQPFQIQKADPGRYQQDTPQASLRDIHQLEEEVSPIPYPARLQQVPLIPLRKARLIVSPKVFLKPRPEVAAKRLQRGLAKHKQLVALPGQAKIGEQAPAIHWLKVKALPEPIRFLTEQVNRKAHLIQFPILNPYPNPSPKASPHPVAPVIQKAGEGRKV